MSQITVSNIAAMQNQSLSSSLVNEQTSQSPSQLVNHIQLPQTSQQQKDIVVETEVCSKDVKPLAFSQAVFTSYNQVDTEESHTPNVIKAEPESSQSCGKVFAYSSQKVSDKENYPDKIEIDFKVKTESCDSQDVKPSPKVEIKMEVETTDNQNNTDTIRTEPMALNKDSVSQVKFDLEENTTSVDSSNSDPFVYCCNVCMKHVKTRYHCSICEDFDLCVSCYNKDGHKHQMEKLGFGLEDDSSNFDPQKTTNPQKLIIQRCVHALVHSCHCREANCREVSCLNIKKIIAHAKQCKRKTNNECGICKAFAALCYHHAKACQEAKCVVHFCLAIRHKLRQQQLQNQILKRSIVTMTNRGIPSTVSQNSGGNSYPINQQSPGSQQPAPSYPSQSGMDIKLSIGENINSIQAVHQNQNVRLAVPSHIATANVSYGKDNPMVRTTTPNTNIS